MQRSLSGSYLHFITFRLDYSNSLLAGVSQSTLGVLQRVQNAAARLIFELGPRDMDYCADWAARRICFDPDKKYNLVGYSNSI